MDNSFHFLLVKDCQSKGNNARILFWRGCLTSSSIFMGHRRLIKLLLSPAIGPTSLLPATQLFENNSCMIITCSISSSHVRTPPPHHPSKGRGGGGGGGRYKWKNKTKKYQVPQLPSPQKRTYKTQTKNNNTIYGPNPQTFEENIIVTTLWQSQPITKFKYNSVFFRLQKLNSRNWKEGESGKVHFGGYLFRWPWSSQKFRFSRKVKLQSSPAKCQLKMFNTGKLIPLPHTLGRKPQLSLWVRQSIAKQ